ncbi:MAG: DUF3489 domain-containing protein, partial [Acidobacteria bacterium]|nr:DUF3489 domain-containing protein [Acidobacteriota bacterium]
MKTFTIDEQNNITVFGTQEEAAATTTTPFDSFTSEQELAELAGAWPPERLVAIWNSIPGVKPVKSVKNAKGAAGRIWERIQSLGETAEPEANSGAHVAKGATSKAKATNKAAAAKSAPKPMKATQVKEANVPREGSKKSLVLGLLRRPNGATMAEIAQATEWQNHSIRGFISGSDPATFYTPSLRS